MALFATSDAGQRTKRNSTTRSNLRPRPRGDDPEESVLQGKAFSQALSLLGISPANPSIPSKNASRCGPVDQVASSENISLNRDGHKKSNRSAKKMIERTTSRYLVGSFQGKWLFKKNKMDEFMVFDDDGQFLYYVDSTRFAIPSNLSGVTQQDWTRISSFRFKPKSKQQRGVDEPLPSNSLAVAAPKGTSISSEIPGIIPKVALNWTKCPANLIRASVWGSLDSSSVRLNCDEIDYIFARVVRADDVCTSTTSEILPYRRRLAVGILQNRTKMTAQEILHMLQKGTFRKISEDLTRSLMAMSPTVEEETKLAASHHLRTQVDDMDFYSMELASIPGLLGKLSCVLTTKTFVSTSRQISQNLALIELASCQLVNPSRLPSVLRVILAIGNFLNDGNSRSNSLGFNISALEMLTLVKANNCSATLMDILVEHLDITFPELVDLTADFPNLAEAVAVSLDGTHEMLSTIEEEEASMVAQIEVLSNDTTFLYLANFLKAYHEQMADIIADLKRRRRCTADSLERMMCFLGERKTDSIARQTEVLQVLKNFSEDLLQARKSLLDRTKIGTQLLTPPPDGYITPIPGASRRGVHWTKVPQNLVPNSLWGTTSGGPIVLPESALNHYFSVDNSKVSEAMEQGSPSDHDTLSVAVLPRKRKYLASIILATCKMNTEQILAVAISPEAEFASSVTSHTVAALAQVCPSNEESCLLLEHDHDTLDEVDRLIHTLAQRCPRIRQRLECLLFLRTFPEDAQEALNEISIYITTVTSVIKSPKLRRVLEIVLAVGNYLNAGTARCGLQGFNIDALKAIVHVKSPLRGVTLMEYLVQEVCQYQIQLPIDDIHFPKRFAFESISERVERVLEVEKTVDELLKTECQDGFYDMVHNSVDGVKTVCAEIRRRLEMLDTKCVEMMAMFAERNSKSRVRQTAVLKVVQDFVENIEFHFERPVEETRYDSFRPLMRASSRWRGRFSSV